MSTKTSEIADLQSALIYPTQETEAPDLKEGQIDPDLLDEAYWMAMINLHEELNHLFSIRAGEEGLTRADIAKKLDKHPSVVSRVLGGKCNVTLKMMSDMARAMDGRIDLHIVDNKSGNAGSNTRPAGAGVFQSERIVWPNERGSRMSNKSTQSIRLQAS